MNIENLPNIIVVDFGYSGSTKAIIVDDEIFYKTQYQDDFGELDFSDDLVQDKINELNLDEGNIGNGELSTIEWNKSESNLTRICFVTGYTYMFDLTEDNYNKYIKPYADIWQQVKDRKDQEQQQAQENYQKFNSRQLRAYDLVKTNYQSALDNAPVITSLGYSADISIDSVATLMGTKLNFENNTYDTVNFVDYYDIDREIDSAKLDIIISEINLTQNHLRNQKQGFIAQIKNTYDNDSLNAILPTLKFTTLDFTQDIDPANEDNVKQYKEVEITIKQYDMLNTIDNM